MRCLPSGNSIRSKRFVVVVVVVVVILSSISFMLCFVLSRDQWLPCLMHSCNNMTHPTNVR